MKGINLVLAAAGGAIVGAAIALLYAPEKGEKTRRHVVDFVKSHCPYIKESEVEKIADQIEATIESTKKK
ncbi:MAG: YtxH domain-containing protein [Bacteroides sp.]|nr:YtxH domain-containing protein [Bacteroides sp.]MCM1096196.1 YtxH domain-containing protein [Terasakiella sp.]